VRHGPIARRDVVFRTTAEGWWLRRSAPIELRRLLNCMIASGFLGTSIERRGGFDFYPIAGGERELTRGLAFDKDDPSLALRPGRGTGCSSIPNRETYLA